MDLKLRTLKRASSGCPEAMDKYVKELERIADISEESDNICVAKPDPRWKFDTEFPTEGVIYGRGREAMLNIYFPTVKASVGFTLADFPEEHWNWILGSLKSQLSEVLQKTYNKGVQDTQKNLRQLLGFGA